MLENILKTFALTSKEIRVFMKLVELGGQPASQIARICEMPRNTVRSILDVLTKKGIVIKSRRANTQYYSAEKKENIIRQLQLQKVKINDQLETQIEMLEKYGDELTAHQWAKSRPRITFYEGLAGLEKVYEDTLTAKNGLKSWASTDEMLDTLPEYFSTYFKRRTKKKIPMRSIHPNTPSSRAVTKNNVAELRETALVDEKKFTWTPEIQIYNNKVNISSWKEKLGIIIESQEIADALRVFFDMSFLYAKKDGVHSGIKNYDALTNVKK